MTTLNFIGDIGLFRTYEEMNIDPFLKVSFPKADIQIANFEFIIHRNRSKAFFDVQEHYSCRFDYFKNLATEKIDIYGLANNHCLDYGLEGAQDSIDALTQKGSMTFGFGKSTDTFHPAFFQKNGISFCLIGFVKPGRWSRAHFGYGPDPYETKNIINLITKYKSLVHHVIIIPHWGTELVDIPNPNDVINAQRFIDAGASLVVGHHPHVPQGVEHYKNGIIAYSLGSFIYIPGEELGYTENPCRDFSHILNITFSRNEIETYKVHPYQLNNLSKLPEPIDIEKYQLLLKYLNDQIHNSASYYRQKSTVLLHRELSSFKERFNSNPQGTIRHYTNYLWGKLFN